MFLQQALMASVWEGGARHSRIGPSCSKNGCGPTSCYFKRIPRASDRAGEFQPAFAIQIEPNAALKTRTRLVRRALRFADYESMTIRNCDHVLLSRDDKFQLVAGLRAAYIFDSTRSGRAVASRQQDN